MKTAIAMQSVALPATMEADGSQWVHVLPAGKVYGRDGRGPYILRDADAVMDATRRYHGATKMMVDYEHQSQHTTTNGKPAPAAGWIVGLQKRADGIWAKVEWTAAAASAIREKAYRYLSPVFSHSHAGEIGVLQNVALTNSPNLDLVALASVDFETETNMDLETVMAELRKLLGLADDADMEAIRAAITALQTSSNSATPDPAQFVPIGVFERVVKDANELRQGVTMQTAVAHVEDQIRTGRLAPMMKDWAVSLCTVNKPAFDSFMTKAGPAYNKIVQPSGISGQAPGTMKASDALSESELAVCSAMGLTPEEFTSSRIRD